MAFPGTITVTTPDFADRTRMPDRFAAEHEDVAPVIEVSGVPAETVELALICHDPDAPIPHGWTHWTVFGIAPDQATLTAASGREGVTTKGEAGYSGPLPPAGHGDHSYYFWVYALSRRVEGEPTREEFLRDYADAVIEQNRVVGSYSR
ncbi:YbhB/YbcL family Raf kinase inhibitor-like protein [Microbacterium halophytorum]|uniref:YbhB/YbcL family Raf kinase inhibitor-like protein n=1 Tax=Microbacterium halophytorum TaxID=2067568 RepID=UPI000CFC0CCD|nr:YbhB/YbcL family Raf kinase inhibitor-like protein [Microbacterium halophytorum]